MKNIIANNRGAVAVYFAIILMVLIGFTALAVEAGRWYLVRAELSKSVDAAALAGAANLSNTHVTPETLATQFGYANFATGYVGTPGTGATGTVAFTTVDPGEGYFQVTGSVSAVGILSQLFGVSTIPISSYGQARKNNVQMMLVLDRSGSMSGTPIRNLKSAAVAFLEYFKDTQDVDKIGLVTFSTNAIVNTSLAANTVTAITSKVTGMSAEGATNAEYALHKAGTDTYGGLPDVSGDTSSVQQYIIFFTDGNPTAFTSTFRGSYNGTTTDYSAVALVTGNCTSSSDSLSSDMGYPDATTVSYYNNSTLPSNPTGDGKPTSTTSCTRTVNKKEQGYLTTRWGSFYSGYPISGYSDPYCTIPTSKLGGKTGYVCATAKTMAIDIATTLKNRGVKIYVIGFNGSGGLNTDFLDDVAGSCSSGGCTTTGFLYTTTDSSTLKEIFQKIAKDIKLRLTK